MAESKLAVLAALAANLLITILKLVAGLLAGSAAMLAEAAHSLSDTGNQVLLLVGMRRAAMPPTPRHPFGTGKASYFWPFLVAVLLFGVAGAYSVIEGIRKVAHPTELGDPRLSLAILGASFAIETGSLAFAVREARKHGPRRPMREFLAENRDASILTVLVEDSLALLGLPIAAASILVAHATHDARWDGIGSLAIGMLLMAFALYLGSHIQELLLGVGLSAADRDKARRILAAHPTVRSVRMMQSMFLGPTSVLLAAELEMHEGLAGDEMTQGLRHLETQLTQAMPVLRYVYLEPHVSGARVGGGAQDRPGA